MTNKKTSENNKTLGIIIFILLFFLVGLLVYGVYLEEKANNLSKENELLKSQIPIWTLKVNCSIDYDNVRINSYVEMDFNSSEEYLAARELFKENKDIECNEILK